MHRLRAFVLQPRVLSACGSSPKQCRLWVHSTGATRELVQPAPKASSPQGVDAPRPLVPGGAVLTQRGAPYFAFVSNSHPLSGNAVAAQRVRVFDADRFAASRPLRSASDADFVRQMAPSRSVRFWHSMMPSGYPHSVSEGYERFFILSFVGCALFSFSMTLSLQALLSSFFSQGTSAGWLVKDILPAVLTAWAAHMFLDVEKHPRKWFLLCNMMTQCAVCADLAIPLLTAAYGPWLLVPAAAGTSFVKGFAWLVLSTSRTALLQTFSREDNLIDITKRFQAMLVVTYPLFSGCALGVVAVCQPSFTVIAAMVGVASLLVLQVAYAMVRPLVPRILHADGAVMCCRQFLAGAPVMCPADAPGARLFPPRPLHPLGFQIGVDLAATVRRADERNECVHILPQRADAQYAFCFTAPPSIPVSGLLPADPVNCSAADPRPTVEFEPARCADAAAAVADPPVRSPIRDAAQSGEVAVSAVLSRENAEKPASTVLVCSAAAREQADLAQRPSRVPEGARFVGVVYSVNAKLRDVLEGLLAALLRVERTVGNTEGNTVPQVDNEMVSRLLSQLKSAGWQVRAHHVDDKDLRIEWCNEKPLEAAGSVHNGVGHAAARGQQRRRRGKKLHDRLQRLARHFSAAGSP